MNRRRFERKLLATVMVVGAASAALALAGPDALVPFKDAAGAAAEVGVGFVLDLGGPAAPVVGCIKVPASDNGYEALQAFTAQEHLAQPQYNPAGLLCSIDGVPAGAPGVCGQSVPGGYQYWSYWYMTNGSGTWTYASRGASATVGSATGGRDVEGWRFQNPGPDNASAPPPRAAPDYASICASVLASLTPSTTSTTTVPPTSTVPSTTTMPPATTAVAPAAATTTAPTTAPTTTTTAAPPTARSATTATAGAALGATAASDTHRDGGSTTPLIVGGLLVALLAGGAAVGWRRRSRVP